MFPLPYPPPIDAILAALFGLVPVSLFVGLLFGRPAADQSGRLPRWLRLLVSAAVTFAALLFWFGRGAGATNGFARLIGFGMVAGFLGDLIMARIIRVPHRLGCGMLVFGVGHAFYIKAFLWLLDTLPEHSLAVARFSAAGTVLFAVLGWYFWIRNPDGPATLNWASMGYAGLVGSMAGIALAVGFVDPSFRPLALGAGLFLASDFLLGNWQIRGHAYRSVNDAIWLTYAMGQLLIVYSNALV